MFLPTLKYKFATVMLIVSSALFIISIVLITYLLPMVIKNEIYKNVRLVENTEQYNRFIELPFPIDFKIYFFNVENPEDIINGSKPKVREVGPYIYKEYRKKTINSTNINEDTISYTQTEKFEFDSIASGNLSDEDYITILNVPMMALLEMAENYGSVNLISNCLQYVFPEFDSVFIKIKVKDILFDGMKFCPNNFSKCPIQKALICKICESKKNVDKSKDGLKFSFFNYKAESNDGLYTVKRGIKNIKTLGQIVRLDDMTFTHYWGGEGSNVPCDEIKGGDSALYPPQITQDSTFQIYSTDICRSIEVNYVKKEYYKGIAGYIFSVNKSTLRSSTPTKEDDCFCSKKTRDVYGQKSCFLDGVIDMQPCIGVPVLVSFPHFLWADKAYIEDIDGLSPNESLHRTFVNVEPITGTPLQGMKRMQINSVLRPFGNIAKLKEVPRVVMPLIWIEEGMSLDDKYIQELNDMYFNKVKIVDIVKWLMLAISTLLTAIFTAYLLHKYCK